RELIKLEAVLAIRLAPLGQSDSLPAKRTVDTARALKLSGVAQLHARGFKGKGIHVAVLDADFRGWQKQQMDGKLNAKTRFLDLTTERNTNLEPDPQPGDPDALGHGTHCAVVVALAAPEAELTLVRIDPQVLPMLFDVMPYFRGSITSSRHLSRRYD